LKRATVVKVHLALASLFLPFLLLIPLSGGLYLLGQKGEQVKTEAFRIESPLPLENTDDFFRQQFKEQGLDFDFEYIRVSGSDFTFRPSSRLHYMASKSENGTTVYKLEPDVIRRLMEIHKGHGPVLIKWLQTGFALAIILVTLSGVYLAINIPAYAKTMGICFGVGLLLIVAALF
jgi:hypothetical protein